MKATLYGLTKNKNDIHVKSQLEKMLAQVSQEGAAVIDGANIAAESIYGKSIVAGSIEATQIKAGAITSDHITANGIVADKIKTGVLRSTNGVSWLNLNDGTFSYANGNFTFQNGKMVVRAHTIELGGEEVPTKTQIEYINKKYEGQSLLDKTEILSGTEIFTDKADDSVAHVDIDGKSVGGGSGKNLATVFRTSTYQTDSTYIIIESDNRVLLKSLFGNSLPSMLKPKYNAFVRAKGGQYTLSFEVSDSSVPIRTTILIRDINGDIITSGVIGHGVYHSSYEGFYYDGSATTRTFTLPQNTYSVSVGLQVTPAGVGQGRENKVFNLQLEEGSRATAYEPPAPTPDYPIEIHSLNDFDVVSDVGRRNLIPLQNLWVDPNKIITHIYKGQDIGIPVNKKYRVKTSLREGMSPIPSFYMTLTSSHVNPNVTSGSYTHVISGGEPSEIVYIPNDYNLKNPDSEMYLSFHPPETSVDLIKDTYQIYGKEEDGISIDGWNSAPEDVQLDTYTPTLYKTNILLSEPLRSVGDVKDRLFRDSDGFWKVERNVGSLSLNGSNFKRYPSITVAGLTKFYTSSIGNVSQNPYKNNSLLMTNQLKMLPVNEGYAGREVGISTYTSGTALYGILPSSIVPDTESEIVAWFHKNPLVVLFQKQEPAIETLPQTDQDKLNNIASYKDSNYLYTIVDKTNTLPEYVRDNLKPTLHATFKGGGWYARFKTDAAKKYIDDLEIGGRNYLKNIQQIQIDGSDRPSTRTHTFSAGVGRIAILNTNLSSYGWLQGYLTDTNLADLKGESITISVSVKTSSNGFRIVADARTPSHQNIVKSNVTPITNTNGNWMRVGVTINFPNDNLSRGDLLFSFSNNGGLKVGDVIEYKDFKLEKGNKATDWTPAPEDVENAYKAVSKAERELAEVNAKAYADGKITAEEQRAIQDAKNKLDEAKKYVDNLEIGGRNLLLNSGDFKNTNGWDSAVSINEKDGYSVLTSVSNFTTPVATKIDSDTEYVYSAEVMFSGNVNITNTTPLHYHWNDGSSNQGAHTGVTLLSNETVARANVWTKIILKTKTKTNLSPNSYFRPHIYGLPSGVRVWVKYFKLEKGNKATDWTEAPEDVELTQNKKVYNPVRYIRDWLKGSSSNAGNHWCEIMVNDTNGTNVAKGKMATPSGAASNLSIVTDGLTNSSYASVDGGKHYVEVDLGSVHYNIASVSIWHYYPDNRTYYETRTEVSEDRINWYPVFDSLTEGTYAETASGKTYPNTRARSEALISAYNMSQQLATSTSKVVINGGNITAGTVKSANSDSWINLDNGQFSFGKGNMVWNGSNLTVKGNIDAASINTGTLATSRIPNLSADKITAGILKDKNNRNNINLDTGTFSLANGNIVYNGSTLSITGGVSFSALDSTTQANITNGAAAKGQADLATQVAQAMAGGKLIYTDPTFRKGTNSVTHYNNSYNGSVVVSRIARPSDAPTTSTHALRIRHTGVASPGWGGIYQNLSSRANARFAVRYIAKIPSGYTLVTATNSMGSGYTDRIVTSSAGTGKYEEYIRIVNCGSTGSFSSGGHLYLSGGSTPTASAPLDWYLASIETYDLTDYEPVPSDVMSEIDYSKIRTSLWSYPSTTEINGSSIRTGSLSADKITTGTLNATNVNIINLNVSKLVGDTANFVQSAWNGINSTVNVDGNGLSVGSSSGALTRLRQGVLEIHRTSSDRMGYIGSTYLVSNRDVNGMAIMADIGKEISIGRRITGSSNYDAFIKIPYNKDVVEISRTLVVRQINIAGTAQYIANSSGNGGIYYDSLRVSLGIGTPSSFTRKLTVNKDSVDVLTSLDMNTNRIVNAGVYRYSSQSGMFDSTGQLYIGGRWGTSIGTADDTGAIQRYIFVQRGETQFFNNLNMQNYTILNNSDRTLKTNITGTTIKALDLFKTYTFVDYNWIDSTKPSGRHMGLIAQDTPYLAEQGSNGIWNINSSKQIMLNSLGIKELDADVTRIDAFVSQHELEIKLLKNRIKQLEDKLA